MKSSMFGEYFHSHLYNYSFSPSFLFAKQVTSFGVGMKAEKFIVHNILSFIVYSTINVAY